MSFCKEEESSDDDICIVSMDQQLFETPDTMVDPSFCGSFPESEPTCMMHHQRLKKMVAFEGSLTRRRFLGCPVQQDEGVNYGVVEWVDAPWPDILQRCLARLWEIYQEQIFGRVKDQQAHDKEVVKLKKEIDFLSNSYSQLVEDVSKLFDYQDGKMSHDMDYTSFLFLLPDNITAAPLDVLGALNPLLDALVVDVGALGAAVENVDDVALGAADFFFLVVLGPSGGADEAGMCELWS
ncbi:putative polyprotein [Hordeum vulgare]|nr:putative polyprotein [Hordeum vulgare]